MGKEKSSKTLDNLEEASFEEAFEELQDLVQKIESGKLTLDQSIDRFEKGVKLAAYCRKRLEEAEGKIQKLTKENELEDFSPNKE